MERLSPRDVAKILPPNTIHTDFKGDLFASLLVEAGFDLEQIMMLRVGSSVSNISKDISSVEHKNMFAVVDSSYIEMKINRRGIYDSLPEGLFHSAVFPNMVKSKERILDEIKHHREEEFFIRRFFSLFENAIEHEAIKIQQTELKYDKKNKYRDFVAVFSVYWPIINMMSTRSALYFINMVPNIHAIRNSMEEISSALSLIMNVPVNIELRKRQTYIKASKGNRIGNMRLGVDSVNVGVLNDADIDLRIHIGDISAHQVNEFLPGNPSHQILMALAEIFLGADKEFDIKINVTPSERKVHLQSPDNAYPCYLGVNSYL